jgi:large subunit ribosomal protein L2
MAINSLRPTTPSSRGTRLVNRSHLEKSGGPKSLTIHKKKTSGRNNTGRITVRHRGGGEKRRIRIIDFKRDKFDIPSKVEGIYFDPNRSANLALLCFTDGEKRYIIAPKGIKKGDVVVSGEKTDVLVGNAMKVKNIPSGTVVHCVEIEPGQGAKLGRSAGQAIVVLGADTTGKYVQLRMTSGEVRMVFADAMATIGQAGNEDKMNEKIGKAGRNRHLGIRPTVRGMAMHAVQHPHGGGEGKGVIGKAKDIWGHRIGTRTRRNKRTDKMIIKRRRTKTRPYAKK